MIKMIYMYVRMYTHIHTQKLTDQKGEINQNHSWKFQHYFQQETD